MRQEPESLKTPEIDRRAPAESGERARIDQIANEMAEKAGKTENEYDKNTRIPATGPGGIS